MSEAGGTTATLSPADQGPQRRGAPGSPPSTCLPMGASGSAASQRLLQTLKLLQSHLWLVQTQEKGAASTGKQAVKHKALSGKTGP